MDTKFQGDATFQVLQGRKDAEKEIKGSGAEAWNLGVWWLLLKD